MVNRIKPLSDAALLDLIETVRAGGTQTDDAARRILRDFTLRQWYGEPQSAVTLEWLAEAFDAILDGAKPADALALLPRAAHRPKDGRAVGEEVAFWLRLTEQRGYTAAEAVALAAQCFAKDAKSIERYRRDNAAMADGMNPALDWESIFLVQGRPLPARRS